ncbi:hypothetical protein Tco_1259961, partial [Tanacetum coccineum]
MKFTDIAALPSRAERYLWLRFDAQDYTNVDIQDFEGRLAKIYDRQVNRVQVLNFDVLTNEMQRVITDKLRMEHIGADGQVLFMSYAGRVLFGIRGPLREFILALGLHTVEDIEFDGFGGYWVDSLREIASKADLQDYWTGISSAGDFLSTVPSYTFIRE